MIILDAPAHRTRTLLAPLSTGASLTDARAQVTPGAILTLIDDAADPTHLPASPERFFGAKLTRRVVHSWFAVAGIVTLALLAIGVVSITEDPQLAAAPNALALAPLGLIAMSCWFVALAVHRTAHHRDRIWQAWNVDLADAEPCSGTVQRVWARELQGTLVDQVVWIRTTHADLFIGELGGQHRTRSGYRASNLPVIGDRVWCWRTAQNRVYAQVQRRG